MKRIDLKRVLAFALPLVLFAAMLAWFIIASTNAASSTDAKELSALKTNIENGITMCYAVEGAYPASIEYLCEHYGLIYDRDKFFVDYERFASNVRPTVTVLERQVGQ